jgi:hypothetical protein
MAEVLSRRRLPLEPVVGLTVRYSFLWHREYAELGRREGLKDRPCIIVSIWQAPLKVPGRFVVDVAPLSHRTEEGAVEIPLAVKKRMGLDAEPTWIATTEVNRFFWPGPDLRPIRHPNFPEETNWHWGVMANDIFNKARNAILARRAEGALRIVPRASR